MYTGPWSYCLVLKALGEPRRSLHLVLQRLEDIFCLWAQQWVWDKGRRRRWGGGTAGLLYCTLELYIHPGRCVFLYVCPTLFRDMSRCSAFAFTQQSHSLQGQQGFTCFLFKNKSSNDKIHWSEKSNTAKWKVKCFAASPSTSVWQETSSSFPWTDSWSPALQNQTLPSKGGRAPLHRTSSAWENTPVTVTWVDKMASGGRVTCVWKYLVSLISKELMKFLASSVISSKLSSSNSHWAAVTKARVSTSLLPWNGDSPLNLMRKEDNSIILRCFKWYPLGGVKYSINRSTDHLSVYILLLSFLGFLNLDFKLETRCTVLRYGKYVHLLLRGRSLILVSRLCCTYRHDCLTSMAG